MNELPDLVLWRLFDQLDLADRLRCRLVSKRFLFLIDSLPSKQLAIQAFTPDLILRPLRWFDDFKAINPRNFIHISAGSQLSQLNLLSSRYCWNLKKLHLNFAFCFFADGKPFQFDPSILNSFIQLRTLLIHFPPKTDKHFKYDCTELIVLKSLVNLLVYIGDFYIPEVSKYTEADRLKLDCENLNFLELKEVTMHPFGNTLHLAHPEQVKHIRISSDNFEYNVDFLKTFKCVRELDCRMRKTSEIPTLIRLIDGYQELLVLSVQFVENFDMTFDLEAIEQLRRHLKTARPALEVYLNGLAMKLFDQLKLFPQVEHLESQLDFYLQNHRSTSKLLRQFTSLSYNHWEPFEQRKQIPGGFLGKLVNLRSIVVDGRVEDPNGLLSKCELITSLQLTNSSLGQTFYSSLSRSAPNLETLRIVDDPKLVESLDFHFLLELSFLVVFSVNRPPDLDLAYQLFMGSFNTQVLEFLIDGRRSTLSILSSNGSLRRSLVDDENLKSWASKLAKDYNRKYEAPLKLVHYKLPVQFAFYYRDVQ